MDWSDILQRAEQVPAVQLLGIEVVSGEEGKAEVRLPYGTRICNSRGIIHGGILSTLADFSGAVALLTLLPRGAFTPTIAMNMNFLSPAGSSVTAFARVLKRGARVGTCSVELRDEAGDLVAVALASYSVAGWTAEKETSP